VLTVTGNDTVTSIKIGSTAVNVENYTIVGDKVTLKKEYLATLAVGDKTFKLLTGATTLTVVVTVEDTTV